ncbi:hypothetical protein AAIH70_16435 [Neorhizobium sp. BT27B]|uniref:hypothetical protein n=1 Tax=Neorhizobium sp. BT27B TaxID=3142625 RepID=UPI003D2E134D
MNIDERHALIAKAWRKALAEGPIDADAELAAWLLEWASAEIEIDELIARYTARQKRQQSEKET